jgi:DNA-binding transcriptional LysR family regulator
VSRAVARLEEAAGVRLFQRTSRRVSLTDEGARLLERAAPPLAELTDALASLSDDAAAVSGRLRVTAPLVTGGREIGAALLDFAAAHPRVALELSLTNVVVDLVGEGVDLAFRAGPVDQGADLVAQRIWVVPFALGASRAFLRRERSGRAAVDREALSSLPAILATPATSWRFRRADGVPVVVRPRARLCVNDPRVAIEAARRGLGVTRAPRAWLAEAELTLLEPAEDLGLPEPGEIYAVYPSRHLVPRRVSLAVAWVTRALKKGALAGG